MTKQCIIRRPKPAEHNDVVCVWMLSWQSTGLGHPKDLTFHELRQKFEDQLAHHWDLYIAEVDAQVMGLLALKVADAQLDQLFIHPEVQGMGIGRDLLDFAKEKLSAGMWLRTAELNMKAIRFYEAAGFIFDRKEARPEWDRNDVYYRWEP